MAALQEWLDEAWYEIYIDSRRACELGRALVRATEKTPHDLMHGYGWFHVAFAEIRVGDGKVAADALRRARAVFDAHGDARGQMLCDEVAAIEKRRESDFQGALALHNRVAARDAACRHDIDLYISYNSRAITQELIGQHETALNDYYRSLEVALQIDSPGPRNTAWCNLCGYHQQLFNFEDARDFGEKAFEAVATTNDRVGIAVSGVELIAVYYALHEFAKAREKAIFLTDVLGRTDPATLRRVSTSIALGHYAVGDIDAALPFLEEGPSALIADGDGVAFWAWVRARCHMARGEIREARELVEGTIAAKSGSSIYEKPYTMMQVYEVAADSCEALGDPAAALRYTKRSRALYEALVRLGANARQVALNVQHQYAEAQKAQLLAEAERSRLEKLNLELEAKVDENERLHAQLRDLALRDSLTGLHNRRYLFEAAPGALELARRHDTPLCVAMLDIDHFKRVNDAFGHQVGDTVLQRFAELLTERLRHSDIICRYGGEEFVVVMPEIRRSEAVSLLRGLQMAFVGHAFSAGVAEYPADGAALEPLLEVADRGLYQAKRQGRALVIGTDHPAYLPSGES